MGLQAQADAFLRQHDKEPRNYWLGRDRPPGGANVDNLGTPLELERALGARAAAVVTSSRDRQLVHDCARAKDLEGYTWSGPPRCLVAPRGRRRLAVRDFLVTHGKATVVRFACVRCGKQVDRIPRGRLAKFCSPRCRVAAHRTLGRAA